MDQQQGVTNKELTEGIQILTQQSETFAFLNDEQDLYSKDDIIEKLP